jgi:hypothetical protein
MIEYRVGVVKTGLDECNGDGSGHVFGKNRADVFKGTEVKVRSFAYI